MKKQFLVLTLLLCAAVLSGCAFGFDAADLLEGNLDLVYHDTYTGRYLSAVGLSKAEARQQYEESIDAEAAYFADYFDVDLALCGDDAAEQIREFCRNLFAHAEYEVGGAVRGGDSYTVEVTVRPLDVIQKFNELDAPALMADWTARYDSGAFDAMTDEAYEAAWAAAVLEPLTARLATVGHLEPETVTVEIRQTEDGLYTLADGDFARIDSLIIAY